MLIKNTTRGFTMFELVIAFAILAILVMVIMPSFISFRRNSLLNNETMNLVTLINKAKLLSVSSKNDNQYGVHLEANQVVLFEGITYATSTATNEIHAFELGLTLSSIVVNGGGSDVVFQKVTGETTQNATTTLLITGTTSSSTILVYPSGMVTVK